MYPILFSRQTITSLQVKELHSIVCNMHFIQNSLGNWGDHPSFFFLIKGKIIFFFIFVIRSSLAI